MNIGIGLNRMDHGIDTGRRGYVTRQTECQRRIKDCEVGIKLAREDADFLIFFGRDHRDIGDFGACASGGGQEDEGDALVLHLIQTINIFELLV